MSVDDYMFLLFDLKVVDVDVPLLVRLEFLDSFLVTIDLTQEKIVPNTGEWGIHLTKRDDHLFIEWGTSLEILYIVEDLRNVHRDFYHPESQELYSVLRRAKRDQFSCADLKELENIVEGCAICQRLSKGLSRLRVTFPESDIVMNGVV